MILPFEERHLAVPYPKMLLCLLGLRQSHQLC